MYKFTSIKKSEVTPDLELKNDTQLGQYQLVSYENKSLIKLKDKIAFAIFFVESNQFLIREESVMSYKNQTKKERHLSFFLTDIEASETPESCLLRALEEKAGLVLRHDYPVDFYKTLHLVPDVICTTHLAILYVSEADYEDVLVKATDGKPVKVGASYLNHLDISDMPTALIVEALKDENRLTM
jgi:8-oxo-dGTP pyrophosphatase MutT (NUDIX family)